jgi:hypothetical protein
MQHAHGDLSLCFADALSRVPEASGSDKNEKSP